MTTARARRDSRGVHSLAGRRADLQGLPRLSGLDLRLAQLDGRARDSRRLHARRGRHPLGRRRRDARTASSATAPSPFRSGRSTPEARRLLETCRAALAAGVEQARAGNRLTDISHAVQQATEGPGFSVVRTLVGHGVGRAMHEDPQIPNYGEPGRGPELAVGMTLAIEPMINAGSPDVYVHDDEWSISTSDGSLSAHFEHSVAITRGGSASSSRCARCRSGRDCRALSGMKRSKRARERVEAATIACRGAARLTVRACP